MDITDAERQLMVEHAAYMHGLFETGKVLVYGPVMAASGAFGMAVFAATNESEVREIMDRDPTITGGLNTYEVSPMRLGGARAPLPQSA